MSLSTQQKMEAFGRMMFGMIEDVLLVKGESQTAFARKTITTPDGKGGKHSVVVFVVAHETTADLMEKGIEANMPIDNLRAAGRPQ